jgi:apolipoprotein N-acyltransferase
LRHIILSNSPENKNLKAVIWSETAVPYVINENQNLLDLLKQAIPHDATLITGGLRIEYTTSLMEIKDVWNDVFAVSHDGIVGNYDKHHLVPFGEYVPFAKFVPFLRNIAGGVGFAEGDGPKTIPTAHFSFSPLVCYEVIFPGEIIDKNNRPDLLVNVTNDAWFGTSSGPYQHFDAAKMRAVEYGISMARAANTGISAYIDPLGNVKNKISLNKEGFIDVKFIEKISPTIFSRFSYWPLTLVLLGLVAFLIFIY